MKGIPLWVWAVIALVAAGAWYGSSRHDAGLAEGRVELAAHLEADKEATAKFNAETVKKDAAQAEALAQIGFRYEREKADALKAQDSIIADLRAGTVRLRDRFRTCPSVSQTPAGAGVDNGETDSGFNQTDAATAFGIAGDGDTGIIQLTACQAILTKERE
jgi:membrane protein involved in colicin uptake